MQQQQEPKKRCRKCYLWLSYSSFHSHRGRKDGLSNWCKKCRRECRHDHSPDKQRKRFLNYKYGLSLSQYNQMFAEQNGVCAVCKMPEGHIHGRTGRVQFLAVDHDHLSGDVRALLCQSCNISLGQMREDPERIRALLQYAEWCQTREPDRKIIQLSMMEDDASGF